MRLFHLKCMLLLVIGGCGVADKDSSEPAGEEVWHVPEPEPEPEVRETIVAENRPVVETPSPACELPTGVQFYSHLRGDWYGEVPRGQMIQHAVFNAPLLVLSLRDANGNGVDSSDPCFEVEVESLTPDFCQIGGIHNGVLSPTLGHGVDLLERAVYLTGVGECVVRTTVRAPSGDEVSMEDHFEYVGVLPSGRCPVIPE